MPSRRAPSQRDPYFAEQRIARAVRQQVPGVGTVANATPVRPLVMQQRRSISQSPGVNPPADPQPWIPDSPDFAAAYTTELFRSGPTSVKMENVAAYGSIGFHLPIDVVAGETFHVGYYARLPAAFGNAYASADVQVFPSGSYLGAGLAYTYHDSWSVIETTVAIPPGTTSANLVMTAASGDGTLYVDDWFADQV